MTQEPAGMTNQILERIARISGTPQHMFVRKTGYFIKGDLATWERKQPGMVNQFLDEMLRERQPTKIQQAMWMITISFAPGRCQEVLAGVAGGSIDQIGKLLDCFPMLVHDNKSSTAAVQVLLDYVRGLDEQLDGQDEQASFRRKAWQVLAFFLEEEIERRVNEGAVHENPPAVMATFLGSVDPSFSDFGMGVLLRHADLLPDSLGRQRAVKGIGRALLAAGADVDGTTTTWKGLRSQDVGDGIVGRICDRWARNSEARGSHETILRLLIDQGANWRTAWETVASREPLLTHALVRREVLDELALTDGARRDPPSHRM